WVQAALGKVPELDAFAADTAKAKEALEKMPEGSQIFVEGYASRDEEKWSGDATLALDRQRRGVTALLFAGVKDEKIYKAPDFGNAGTGNKTRGVRYRVVPAPDLAKLKAELIKYADENDAKTLGKAQIYTDERVTDLRDDIRHNYKRVYGCIGGTAIAILPFNTDYLAGWGMGGVHGDVELVIAKERRFPSIIFGASGYLGENTSNWRSDVELGVRALDVDLGESDVVHFGLVPSLFYTHTSFSVKTNNFAEATSDGGGVRLYLPWRFEGDYGSFEIGPFGTLTFNRLAYDSVPDEAGGLTTEQYNTGEVGATAGYRF
ncbi:MAG: hypothetical protein WC269_02695, partial [Candidatus Gracilibacteria bacterium]